MVQWLRPRAPNAGDVGSIPDRGTGSHMPQLGVCTPQLKDPCMPATSGIPFQRGSRILCAPTRTRHNQIISKYNKCKMWMDAAEFLSIAGLFALASDSSSLDPYWHKIVSEFSILPT